MIGFAQKLVAGMVTLEKELQAQDISVLETDTR
jgi:hypothetical protein